MKFDAIWRIVAVGVLLGGCKEAPSPTVLDGDGLPSEPWDSVVGEIGEPLFEMGESVGMFEIVGGLILDDGTVLIVTKQELHYFDAEGEFIRKRGRAGAGPGEYGEISHVARWAGDSVSVTDAQRRRTTIIDQQGDHARTIPLLPGPWIAAATFRLRDSTIVVADRPFRNTARQGSMWRDTVALRRYSPSGEYLHDLLSVLGDEVFIGEEFGLNAIVPPPQQKRLMVGAAGGRLVLASPDSATVRFMSPSGEVEQTLQAAVIVQETDQSHAAVHMAEQLARFEDDQVSQGRFRKLLDEVPLGGNVAYLSRMLSTANSDVWLAKYASAGYEPIRWLRVSVDGHFLGAISTPSGYRLLDVNGSTALLFQRDTAGVERTFVATVK